MIDFPRVYARHAAAFDRVRTGSTMERPYLDAACALVPAPARVLDVGCGTGEPIARYFVERGYSVTGIDLVPEMLDLARARFPEMTWLRTDMRALDASLNTSEYRERLSALGLRVVRHSVEDPDCGGHTVWIAQLGP